MGYLASFVISLILLVVAKRWVDQQVQTVILGATRSEGLTIMLFALIFLPGTIVHEGSHWLVARLLGVRTGKVSLLPQRKGRDQIVMGSVMVAQADPVRSSLVGLAPLLGGSLVVILLVQFALGISGPHTLFYDEQGLAKLGKQILDLFRTQDVWLYLYLLFAVSNSMLPSPSDRNAWPTLLAYAALVGVVTYLLTGVPTIPGDVAQNAGLALDYLSFAFVITLLVDFVALGVLIPLGLILTRDL
ncbi:MAG: hypothetical protein GXP41_06440 [Chloroflexi bacterium]|nr:hypothetical protein [Chloroflexota bacterium]